jgi:hypothetical protein
MERHLTHLDVPRGHVVVYDNRLIHGSNPARAGHVRIALAAAFIPSEADLLYYVDLPSGETVSYVVTDDYFIDLDNPDDWGAVDSGWRPPVGDGVVEVRPVGPTHHRLLTEDDLVGLRPAAPRATLLVDDRPSSGSRSPAVQAEARGRAGRFHRRWPRRRSRPERTR